MFFTKLLLTAFVAGLLLVVMMTMMMMMMTVVGWESRDQMRNIETDRSVSSFQLTTENQRKNSQIEQQGECVLRFICEIHSHGLQYSDHADEIEKSVINLLKQFGMVSPSNAAYKFTFAAHMGNLLGDSVYDTNSKSGVVVSDGGACHRLYPSCPFNRHSMLLLVKSMNKIPLNSIS